MVPSESSNPPVATASRKVDGPWCVVVGGLVLLAPPMAAPVLMRRWSHRGHQAAWCVVQGAYVSSATVLWCTVALRVEPSMLIDLIPLMIAFAVLHGLLLLAAARFVRAGLHA